MTDLAKNLEDSIVSLVRSVNSFSGAFENIHKFSLRISGIWTTVNYVRGDIVNFVGECSGNILEVDDKHNFVSIFF